MMTFTWTGYIGHLADEDIIEIVADMRYDETIEEHLHRIDPEGTLNISAAELYERARGLGL